MTGYPVLVVDDHQLVGTALCLAFRARGFDARRIPGSAVPEFLSRPAVGRTGLVVIDLDLVAVPLMCGSRTGGANLVESFRQRGWKVLVVVGSHDEVGVEVAAAIASGAIGSLPKATTSFDNLIRTVVTAAEDKAVMSAAEHQAWLARHHSNRTWERELSRLLDRLTNREREVLEMLAEGHRAAEIAGQRVVSITTVRTQIRAILAKLEVNSQQEAVALLRPPSSDRFPERRNSSPSP
jgi:DNA-binding NarL/FixJ family response regulator